MRPRTDKIVAPERQAALFDLIGSTIAGKYKLERLLGAGGMGGVYAATPVAGGPQVAIKVLSVADPTTRDRIAKRFSREARAVSALHCPHVVTVLDAGSDETRPYLVMELLDGEDLGQRIRQIGHLSVQVALHMAAQILVALGTAHEAGFVHRDLKPDNIFITKRGSDATFCKLLDFGMTKVMPGEGQTLALALTKKGMAVGTPFYMAPEQARALADVDGRVDLWALGAILFECLAGRPPFVGPSQEQVLIQICTTAAPDVRALRPDVPSKVAKLIARALTRDRNQRFLSAWQMLTAVVEVAPEEKALLPARMHTSLDVPISVGPAPSVAERSGPHSATVALGPLPMNADGSGSQPAIRISQSGPHRQSLASMPQPPPTSRTLSIVVVALCALMLGIGVAVYVLAITRSR